MGSQAGHENPIHGVRWNAALAGNLVVSSQLLFSTEVQRLAG